MAQIFVGTTTMVTDIYGMRSYNIGHILTYLILTDDTQKVVLRSRVCPATENGPNLRVESLRGEDF